MLFYVIDYTLLIVKSKWRRKGRDWVCVLTLLNSGLFYLMYSDNFTGPELSKV